MSQPPPNDAVTLLAGATTLYEATDMVFVRNGEQYMEAVASLLQGDIAQQTKALLQAIRKLMPSEPFIPLFGKTKGPVMLLFAPTLLLRAASLLASQSSDVYSMGSEWYGISSFLLCTERELLVSPGQQVVRVTLLPDPPHISSVMHPRALSSILSQTALEDIVPFPPSASREKKTLDAGSFGCVLYNIICGLVNFLHIILTLPKRVVCGAGIMSFCGEIIRLLLSSTVIIYGSKETNLQIASASLLVMVRSVLDMREDLEEIRQEDLIGQWCTCVRYWFDLTTQSGNAVCMQYLFPYMMSPDMALNM